MTCTKCNVQIHHLGLYENEQDAARVYDRAAVLLRGPNAALNFPTVSAPVVPQQTPPAGHSSLAAGTQDPRDKAPVVTGAPATSMAQGSLPTSQRTMCAH